MFNDYDSFNLTGPPLKYTNKQSASSHGIRRTHTESIRTT